LKYRDQDGTDPPAIKSHDHCPAKGGVLPRLKQIQVGKADRDFRQRDADGEKHNAGISGLQTR
jgi:hypothetical protein